MRVAITDFMIFSMVTKLPIGADFTRPLADFVCSTIRTGPKESCSEGACLDRQLCSNPTYEVLKSRGVFPMGVLQQWVYHRRRPWSDKDMQTRASTPCVK